VNGTSGTGKWATSSPGSRVRPVVGLYSALVPRESIPATLVIKDLSGQRQESKVPGD
jgi:hypothetical protein